MKNIQCLILCGGLGSRLGKITKKIPKPLILIKNKIFLEILISIMEKKGIKNFNLSLYYKSKAFSHFKQHNIIKERKKLGSGGAILNCLKKINTKNIIVINGDTLVKFSLARLFNSHLSSRKAITILTVKKNSEYRYGGFFKINKSIIFDKNNKKGLIDCGIYIINKKKFLKNFSKTGNFESSEIIRHFLKLGKINIHCQKDGGFLDIGLRKDLIFLKKNFSVLIKKF